MEQERGIRALAPHKVVQALLGVSPEDGRSGPRVSKLTGQWILNNQQVQKLTIHFLLAFDEILFPSLR